MARVLVGMSGGVDSAVAAKVLIDAGHQVAGVTLSLVPSIGAIRDASGAQSRTCCSLEDVQAARETCYRLGIEHFVFNFRDAFVECVMRPFVDSYLAGETPNPCVECNRLVKFGKLIERARLLGYDFLATGHYARISRSESGRYLLRRGADAAKDQSYVLYPLTQDQLSATMFPLGEMTKSQVRAIAAEAGFASANKPESQDICFVPDGDYAGFIERYAPGSVRPGDFVDLGGKPVGRHRGVVRYTIGQRRGIAVAFGKPTYVVAKDAEANTVTLGSDEDLRAKTVIARDTNLVSLARIEGSVRVTAKIRYNQTDQPATVRARGDGRVLVEFDEPQRAVAPGQSVVFYDGDVVVGGGIIAGTA